MANKDSIDPGLRFSKIEDFAESLNQWRFLKKFFMYSNLLYNFQNMKKKFLFDIVLIVFYVSQAMELVKN